MLVAHLINWYAGWGLILCAFLTGAIIGLGFHREEFWGGYSSFRRRIVRLGHIALAALGMMNVIFSVAVPGSSQLQHASSILLIVGAVSMAGTCFLSGWKPVFRHLFFIPVLSLVTAVVLILIGGVP